MKRVTLGKLSVYSKRQLSLRARHPFMHAISNIMATYSMSSRLLT